MPTKVHGFVLQDTPPVYVASIPGRWLIKHATPSWRIEDPEKGFQRVVNEKRAVEIARTVLDGGRTFPNAIVLASDRASIPHDEDSLTLPDKIKFLVVDGQHRLWAQKFSEFEAQYACLIHMSLSEEEMATLFIEINDTQKRVPPSLRWDLIRLVRPDDESHMVRAADLVYALATEEQSPLFQRIDLTGETPALRIKQASLAPEIRAVISRQPLKEFGFDVQSSVLISFFEAMRELDPKQWREGTSVLSRNRILRVLIRLIPKLLTKGKTAPDKASPQDFYKYLKKLDLATLDPEEIRGQQGSAGMTEIQLTVEHQLGV